MKTDSENKIDHSADQSHLFRTFQNKNHVNKTDQSKRTTSGQSDINTLKSGQSSKDNEHENLDRENFYHWGATRERIDIIRRRNNSPETRRLVERRNALYRPGTLRRRYDRQSLAPRNRRTRCRTDPEEEPYRGQLSTDTTRRRGSTGRNTGRMKNRTRDGRNRRKYYNHAPRQSTNCRSNKIQHRRERSQVYTNQPYRRQTYYKKESNRRSHQESRVRFQDGFKDSNLQDGNRPGTPEKTRVRNSMRREDRETIPEGYRAVFDELASYHIGPHIRRGPNRHFNRP